MSDSEEYSSTEEDYDLIYLIFSRRRKRPGLLQPDFHSHLSPIADAIFRQRKISR